MILFELQPESTEEANEAIGSPIYGGRRRDEGEGDQAGGEREREFGHLSLWRRRRRRGAAPGVASNTLGSERQYAKCALRRRRALPPPADV